MKAKKLFAITVLLCLIVTFIPFTVIADEITVKETASGLDYFDIYDFHDGLARVQLSFGKEGFIDKTGKEVIPVGIYQSVANFHDGLAVVFNKDDEVGIIDTTGKVVVPFGDYDSIGKSPDYIFNEGMITVQKNGKWGYIDTTGKIAVSLEYDWFGGIFSEGLAYISKNGKVGYIDKTGKVVIPFEYDSGKDFKDGLANVKKGEKFGYIDKTGKVVIPFEYDYMRDFNDGVVALLKNDKMGVVDKTGKVVVPFEYGLVSDFNSGVAIVGKSELGNDWGIIDKTGKFVVPYNKYDSFIVCDGMIAVKKDGKWGYIDTSGNVVIPLEYDFAAAFNEGLAYVSKDGKYGYIDKTGKVIVPFDDYNLMRRDFCNGFAIVNKNEKWSIFEIQKSTVVIPEPVKPAIAAPSAQKVLVNGKETAFDAYLINDSNYFKLRDLAYIFSGTEKQFEVGWDADNNAISLTSGKAYTEVGGEMAGKGSGNKTGTPTSSGIYLDGKEVSFTAYNIDGNNYFKLRDIMKAFDIYVGWDDATKTITLDTSKGYVD